MIFLEFSKNKNKQKYISSERSNATHILNLNINLLIISILPLKSDINQNFLETKATNLHEYCSSVKHPKMFSFIKKETTKMMHIKAIKSVTGYRSGLISSTD